VPYSIDCCGISASLCGKEVTKFGSGNARRRAAQRCARHDVHNARGVGRSALAQNARNSRNDADRARLPRIDHATKSLIRDAELRHVAGNGRLLDTELRPLRDAPVQTAVLRYGT
jgi:hypothetical protein